MVPEYDQADVRELLRHPYRIIYRVDSEEVVVLTVMHGRQLLPDELGSED
jgi:toxin ParE1/3/4